MNAAMLLVSTFCLVFALGLQSQFVNNGHYAAAFINSSMISIGQLGALQIIHATTPVEYACYILGGPIGIICSMLFYRKFIRRSKHVVG